VLASASERAGVVERRDDPLVNLLSLRDVSVEYGVGRRSITAVDDVSIDLPPGEVLGLVGESGSGKSTLAKAIVGLAPLSRGAIALDGEAISGPGRAARDRRRRVQMVFQDPYSSLDPRMTIGESMVEALTVRGRLSRNQRSAEIDRLLDLVSLDPSLTTAIPRQLSGGQLQRISIARALAADPRLLIADEITSSLDVSVQGAVLNVVRDIRVSLGLTMLFISHNVAVVRYISDTIAVMYLGQIVEVGATEELIANPRHPYTKVLLDSVPGGAAGTGHRSQPLDGELPDPHQPPTGCRFHPRCPVGPLVVPSRTICATLDPGAEALHRPNRAACHFAGDAPEPSITTGSSG
jgi:peptide/nickel transport system ATP-binding protein